MPDTENAPLIDRQPQNRCCSGRFRVYGPDGVWSWGVAFANFMISFIVVGLGRMSGILYVDFMHLFDIDRKMASLPFSIQQAGRNLFGPVAGILGQKYGLRIVTVVGGVIGALSAAIAYFKMNVTSITILWGLFFGFATALTTTLNQVSIDQYFEKHRATAGGFAFSGGCIGAFIFPVVLEALIPNYGMPGTFLVLGAIILFVVPAAMMLSEPPWKLEEIAEKSVNNTEVGRTNTSYGGCDSGEASCSYDNTGEIEANKQLTEPRDINPIADSIDFTVLEANGDMVYQFLTVDFSYESTPWKLDQNDLHKIDKTELINELESIYSSIIYPNKHKLISRVSIEDEIESDDEHSPILDSVDLLINYAEDVLNGVDNSHNNVTKDKVTKLFICKKLKELYGAKGTQLVAHFPYRDQSLAWKLLVELRKLYDAITDMVYLPTAYRKACHLPSSKLGAKDKPLAEQDSTKDANTFCSLIKTAIELHGNPLFLLICICRGVFMLTFIPVVTIIVDFAMDKGIDRSYGKYIIATLSLGDLIGRLCLGWVTDRGCLSLPRYMLFCMIILGASTATLPFANSLAAFVPAVLFFGILQGSLFVRHNLLVTQYMESHERAIGMGFINFLSGFLGFALPSFIGYFRDTLGSYQKMFYLNGILSAVVGLLWILEPLFVRINSSRSARMGNAGR